MKKKTKTVIVISAAGAQIVGGARVTPYRVPADNAYYYDSIRGMSVVVPNLPLNDK